jgi:sugar/nucleoside kinase (ribokinase family)
MASSPDNPANPTPTHARAANPTPARTIPRPTPPRAIAAGHICLDLMPGLGNRPLDLRPGELRIVDPLTVATGGSVSNTGIALHRLGVPTRLVALIGDDPLAAVLRAALDEESPGLGDGLVIRPGESTSYSVILSSASTDRIVFHFPGTNDTFAAADLSDDALTGAELLHVGYPPLMRRLCQDGGRELELMLRRAHDRGLATSLDMAEPDRRVGEVSWPALLARVLPHVDAFCPSLGELAAMLGRGAVGPAGGREADTGGREPDTGDREPAATERWTGDTPPDEGLVRTLAEAALDLGAALVAVKVGAYGLVLRTGAKGRMEELADRLPGLSAADWADRELWCPIFEVPVRGTTGSGDATIAGFLAALLDRAAPPQALDLATAVGSLCVEADDAVSGIRNRAEADARAASPLPRPAPPLPDTWRPIPGSSILAGPNDRRTA